MEEIEFNFDETKIIINYSLKDKKNTVKIDGPILDEEIYIIFKLERYDRDFQLFGKEFIKNNENKCFIIYNGEKYNLNHFFSYERKKEFYAIKLKGINNITDLSHMFHYDRYKGLNFYIFQIGIQKMLLI